MKITNNTNLPQPIVNVVKKTAYRSKPRRYGITTLLKGNTEIILSRRYWDELSEDVADDIWALFGTSLHAYLEAHDTTGYAECKFEIPISNSYVVGVVDLIDKANKKIWDYKTTTVWKVVFKDYEDWRKQLLGYCWGIWKTKKVKYYNASIVAILRDWTKSKAIDPSYPSKNVVQIDFVFTDKDFDECEYFITEKVKSLETQKYWQTKALLECSDKEKWTTPTTYAVYKNENKTAVRVLSSEQEAKDYAEKLQDGKNKYSVVERKGQDKKCEEYCRVRSICPFRKRDEN